jgi:hypothetical protein
MDTMSLIKIIISHKTILSEFRVTVITTDMSSLPAITNPQVTGKSSRGERDETIRVTTRKTMVVSLAVITQGSTMKVQRKTDHKAIINQLQDTHNSKDRQLDHMKIISTKLPELRADPKTHKGILIQWQYYKIMEASKTVILTKIGSIRVLATDRHLKLTETPVKTVFTNPS